MVAVLHVSLRVRLVGVALAVLGCSAEPTRGDLAPDDSNERRSPWVPSTSLPDPPESDPRAAVFPVGPPTTVSVTQGPRESHAEAYDFAAAAGTPIRAIASGVVRKLRLEGGENCTESPSCSNANANYVVLDHLFDGERVSSLYLHLANDPEATLEEGDLVERGAVIGAMGDTGFTVPANFVHLHFQLQRGCASYWCTAEPLTDWLPEGFADVGVPEEDDELTGGQLPPVCGEVQAVGADEGAACVERADGQGPWLPCCGDPADPEDPEDPGCGEFEANGSDGAACTARSDGEGRWIACCDPDGDAPACGEFPSAFSEAHCTERADGHGPWLPCCEVSACAESPSAHLYLMAGQSNLRGYLPRDSSLLSPTNAWFWVSEPRPDGTDAGERSWRSHTELGPQVGPEVSMAAALEARHPGERVYVVKVAAAGSALVSTWDPARSWNASVDGLLPQLERALLDAQSALCASEGFRATPRAFVFVQGETEGDAHAVSVAAAWGGAFDAVVPRVHAALGATVPVVLHRISLQQSPVHGGPARHHASVVAVRDAQVAAAPRWGGRWVDTDDLGRRDAYHFDDAGTVTFGQRIAAALP